MSKRDRVFISRSLAISIGIVYMWFGVLKFFPHLSPAEDLAKNTIDMLSFHLIPAHISIILLAIWETGVGLLLILNIYRKPVIVITLIHMVFTFAPLVFFPDQSFTGSPVSLSLLGQYIIKNIIIISALVTLYKLSSQDDELKVVI